MGNIINCTFHHKKSPSLLSNEMITFCAGQDQLKSKIIRICWESYQWFQMGTTGKGSHFSLIWQKNDMYLYIYTHTYHSFDDIHDIYNSFDHIWCIIYIIYIAMIYISHIYHYIYYYMYDYIYNHHCSRLFGFHCCCCYCCFLIKQYKRRQYQSIQTREKTFSSNPGTYIALFLFVCLYLFCDSVCKLLTSLTLLWFFWSWNRGSDAIPKIRKETNNEQANKLCSETERRHY